MRSSLPLAVLLAACSSSAANAPPPPPVAPPTVDVARPELTPPSEPSPGLAIELEPRPRRGPPPDGPVRPSINHGVCMRGRFCELEGFCSQDAEGQCIAATDEDCKPSAACKGGRCTAFEGRCIAADDEDCRTSWACKGYGRCNHDGEEACMATSAGDCRASTRCQRVGECTLRGGECVK